MIPALVNHLWQSTLFAMGVGLLTLTMRKNGAGVRYGLWLAASVKFLMPFALLAGAGEAVVARLHLMVAPPPGFAMPSLAIIAPVIEPLAPASVASAPTSALTAPATLPAVPHASIPAHHAAAVSFHPAPILLGVWALGLAVVLLVWAVRWSRIRAALRAASLIDLPAPFPVLSSPVLLEPGVVGIRRPMLLVPEGIAERLSPAELRAVMAHELCHIRRGDNLTGAIHMVVAALFWFHPLVWWLGGRLIAERERACDEAVVTAGVDPRTYAEGILKVCRLYLKQPLACAAGVSGADLKRRMLRIMASPISLRLSVPKTLLLAAAAVLSVAAPVSAGLFASVPMAARAQAASAEPVLPRAVMSGAAPANESLPVVATQSADGTATSHTQPADPKPIVLAAIRTWLTPIPEVDHADAEGSHVATELSRATSDAPPIPTTTTAEPTGGSIAPASLRSIVSEPVDAKAEASNFVRSYAESPDFHMVRRWHSPVCVQVYGLTANDDAAVRARVEAVAGTDPEACHAKNVSIVFSTDPQRTLDDMIAQKPGQWALTSKTKKTASRPIQAWYGIDDGDMWGTPRVSQELSPSVGRLSSALVIVDLRRTADMRLGVLADYVAMLVLSQPRSLDRCQAAPSITDLFAGPCPGRAAPNGLTPDDKAYLTALYTGGTLLGGIYLDEIASRMAKVLAAQPGAKAP